MKKGPLQHSGQLTEEQNLKRKHQSSCQLFHEEISSFIGRHLEQVPFPVHIPPVAVDNGFSKGLLIEMAPKKAGSASLLKIGNEHGSSSGA